MSPKASYIESSGEDINYQHIWGYIIHVSYYRRILTPLLADSMGVPFVELGNRHNVQGKAEFHIDITHTNLV